MLKSRAQRAGFALAIAGCVLLVVGLSLAAYDAWSFSSRRIPTRLFSRWWESALGDRNYDGAWLTAWGTYLTAVGVYVWLLHERTIGRVWHWIGSGQRS